MSPELDYIKKFRVQARLHNMKDSWWKQKAEALQHAADMNNSKGWLL